MEVTIRRTKDKSVKVATFETFTFYSINCYTVFLKKRINNFYDIKGKAAQLSK